MVESDPAQATRIHRRFHLTLYSRAGARLLQLIENQFNAADRYLRLEIVEMENFSEDMDEHRALLATCRMHDATKTIALLGLHIEEGGRDLAAKLAKARRERVDAPTSRKA